MSNNLNNNMKSTWRLLIVMAGLLSVVVPTFAEGLTLYAAAGVKSPVEQMAKDFERSTGQKINLVFDTAGAAEQRFLADPDAVFLVTTQTRISTAEKSGKLKDGVTNVIGDTVGGFAAPPGKSKPDISTPDKLKAALLAAPHIAFSDPARGATVGTHFLKVIDALGIKEQVLSKATLAVDGVQTMHLVLEGKADLGVTQLSEIMQADPASLVGAFPKEFDLATRYSLWRRADASPIANDFAKLITSPTERPKLMAHGLRPPA
jgi:molybdate transport system substrate-binding protein